MTTLDADINNTIAYTAQTGYRILRVILVDYQQEVHVHDGDVNCHCISLNTCLEGNQENTGFDFRTYFPCITYNIIQDATRYITTKLETEDRNIYTVC